MAREGDVRQRCIQAGLVNVLVPHLNSNNQEMLLNTGRAIGRICFDDLSQQEQLVQAGVIPRLLSIMREYPENEPLVNVCLLALCNLADMDSTREALVGTDFTQLLTIQLKRAPNAERRHLILEILGSISQSETVKLQVGESGVLKALIQTTEELRGSCEPHDLCSIRIASSLIVSLLEGEESLQSCCAEGSVYEDVLSWLQSPNRQLQLSAALAVSRWASSDRTRVKMLELHVLPALLTLLEQNLDEGDVSLQNAALTALRNLAGPALNKVRLFEEGVTERLKLLLLSDSPLLGFRLLDTLRTMVDGQEPAACSLGTDPDLVLQLTSCCGASDPGVQGEAVRLLAAVVTNSHSPEVVCTVATAGGIQHLISMATSQHVVLQNEALAALSTACTADFESVKTPFQDNQLVSTLKTLLDGEGTAQTKIKALALVHSLADSGVGKHDIDLVDLKESLNKLTHHSNSEVASQATSLLPRLCDSS